MFLSNNYTDLTEHLKGDVPEPLGSQLLLKLFVRDAETEGGIKIPEKMREEDIYKSMVGLVMSKGAEVYKEDHLKNWKSPELGDWVLFKPNSGTRFSYHGIPFRFVYDDCIYCTIKDPAAVHHG
jgi:co-chaperonin GroES (HSP10)